MTNVVRLLRVMTKDNDSNYIKLHGKWFTIICHAIGQRSVSGRGKGKAKHFGPESELYIISRGSEQPK
ncbi:hypothetical protein YC2023_014569 [Brassica napus]